MELLVSHEDSDEILAGSGKSPYPLIDNMGFNSLGYDISVDILEEQKKSEVKEYQMMHQVNMEHQVPD